MRSLNEVAGKSFSRAPQEVTVSSANGKMKP